MASALLKIDTAVAMAQARQELDQQPPETADLLNEISRRKRTLDQEMTLFAMECDRWDNLYYPTDFATGGVSHWAFDPSARTPGRSHVSDNVYPIYVEIPAALQSMKAVENMVSTEDSEPGRELAAAIERFYMAWKEADDVELKGHQACTVKELYGRTAGKVFWNAEKEQVELEIVDQPRNLWLGWRNSSYRELEWCLYTYRVSPDVALADFGLVIDSVKTGGVVTPFVSNPNISAPFQPASNAINLGITDMDLQVEVYDYWYRRPAAGAKIRFGKATRYETWNAIFVGQYLVAHVRHPEYKGKMPFVPLFNTYLPGVPNGRAALRDIEQLIREKDERLSENAQMMSRAVNGQFWQIVGENAPSEGSQDIKPVPNTVHSFGPGNRLEAITPWMPEFQMDAYLTRLDRELADVSGLNDLLRGQAPQQVMNSGKAISALVANYELRVTMKRDLFYRWKRDVWELAASVWATKNKELKPAIEGKAKLQIKPPSLTPRDDIETATMVGALVDRKLMAARTGMDLTGRDDPETEQNIIRDEQTDATLNPQAVQVMAQLLQILMSMGIQPQPQVQAAVGQQAQSLADVRALAPGGAGQPQLNAPGENPATAPQFMPGNTVQGQAQGAGGPPLLGAGPPLPPPGQDVTLQTMIKGGEAQSRILQQQKIQSQGG